METSPATHIRADAHTNTHAEKQLSTHTHAGKRSAPDLVSLRVADQIISKEAKAVKQPQTETHPLHGDAREFLRYLVRLLLF